MPALKQIHRCTRKHTHAAGQEERSHTPVYEADDEWTLLCSVSCEAQAPLCPVSDAFLALPLQKSQHSSGSAERHGNVSTRQEPRSSLVPLLISSTWNCLSAR